MANNWLGYEPKPAVEKLIALKDETLSKLLYTFVLFNLCCLCILQVHEPVLCNQKVCVAH